MARKAVEQELSRDKIINVARELFAAHGYRRVSMRSIGKELGYSHGALYYHFKEKAELFHAIIKEDFNLLGHKLLDVLNHPNPIVDSKVEQIMLEFIRFGLEHPHHYEMMFMVGDLDLQQYSKTEQKQCYEHFAHVINEAVRKGHLSPAVKRNISWQLFLSVHGFITHYIHSHRKYSDVKEKAQEHVHFLCKALA